MSAADNFAKARQRLVEVAADAAVKRMQYGAKPTLKRYTWSRFHSSLLDDNRWPLVAQRAKAPLPYVEALVMRLEAHANSSQPRGYVGDFSVEGMAARWHVDADMVARIFAELERPDIGWIDQDHVVSFWDRNPDKVDDTAAVRQQRVRDRKKGMRELALLHRRGLITNELRLEREVALKNSKEPAEIMASWPELSTASRRDSVTVTTRAEQIIQTEARGKAVRSTGKGSREDSVGPFPAEKVETHGQAQLWLRTEGERIITERMSVMRSKASQLLERWSAGVEGNLVVLVQIVGAAAAGQASGEAFERIVEGQIGRHNADRQGPSLPFGPVGLNKP